MLYANNYTNWVNFAFLVLRTRYIYTVLCHVTGLELELWLGARSLPRVFPSVRCFPPDGLKQARTGVPTGLPNEAGNLIGYIFIHFHGNRAEFTRSSSWSDLAESGAGGEEIGRGVRESSSWSLRGDLLWRLRWQTEHVQENHFSYRVHRGKWSS